MNETDSSQDVLGSHEENLARAEHARGASDINSKFQKGEPGVVTGLLNAGYTFESYNILDKGWYHTTMANSDGDRQVIVTKVAFPVMMAPHYKGDGQRDLEAEQARYRRQFSEVASGTYEEGNYLED